MTDITIYNPDGSVWRRVPVTENAKWEQEIMKSDMITLSWNGGSCDKIKMGCYILNPYTGGKYTILEHYYPQSRDNVEFQYNPIFQHELWMLAKMPFLFYTYKDGEVNSVESDWNFTGRGSDLAETLADTIYKSIGVNYTIDIDDSIEASLSLQFANVDVLSAINNIAAAWNCEWWTEEMITNDHTQKIIHFGDMCVHLGSGTTGYPLIAGDNIESPNSNQKATYFNRFYVFGGTKNIAQDYQGAQANHVVNKRLTLDPEKFPHGYIELPVFDEDGKATWDATNKKYITDLTDSDPRFTKVITIEDIYPKSNCRVKYGTLQRSRQFVKDANTGKPVQLADGTYDTWYIYAFHLEYQKSDGTWDDFGNIFKKSVYDKDSNPTGNLIKGLNLSVHFNSGALEGREFEVTYYDANDTIYGAEASDNIHVDKGTFKIIHTEDNTIIIPNTGIAPDAGTDAGTHDGDKVVVFNCRMPDSYYYTAYNELEEEAIRQIYESTKDSNQYVVKSNPLAFAKNQPNLTMGRRIALNVAGRDIDTRVVKLVTHIDRNFEQEITMSKAISKGAISTLITTLERTEQKVTTIQAVDDTQRKLTKQQFYEAIDEQIGAMFDTDGNFNEPISPLVINTALIKVGATSTNFQLFGIEFKPNYYNDAEYVCNNLFIKSYLEQTGGLGYLIHFGITENGEPRRWDMQQELVTWYENGVATSDPDLDAIYYLYAECSVDGTGGRFMLDTKQRMFNDNAEFYYFLVGTMSSATNLNGIYLRVLNASYGQTTINGRQISSGRIQSVTGDTYIDLDSGDIQGNFKFKSKEGTTQELTEYVNNLVGEEVTEATKDLKIKGDNLYRNTADFSGDKLWIYNINSAIGSTTALFSPTLDGETYNNNKVATTALAWSGFGQDFDCEHSTKYTMSCYVRSNTNMAGYVYYNDNGRSSYTSSGIVRFGEEWQRIVFTFTTTSTATKARVMLECTTSDKWYCSSIKVEKGNTATDWIANANDVTDKIKMQEYLQQAIQDTTEVRGGLLLTQMIGVGSGDNTTAGMNGSGSGDDTIRFWAGSTSFGDASDAPFRVFDNGRVVMSKAQIESTSGTNKLSLADGSILLYDGDNPLTQIIPIKAGTIDDAIKLFNQGSIATTSSLQATATISAVNNIATWNETKWEEYIDKDVRVGSGQKIYDVFTATGSGIMTISTNPTLTCTKQVTYPIERIGNDPAGSPFYYMTNQKNTTHTYVVQLLIGGIVVKTFNSVGTISLTGAYNVAQGQKVQIRISYTSTCTLSVRCNHNNNVQAYGWGNSADSTEGILTLSSFKYSVSFAKYNSKYLADGFILSNATDNYMAYIPTAGKTRESFRLRQGNTILRMIGEQLTINYAGNTASLYNLNPLVMIVQLTWQSSTTKFTASILYNPLGKSSIPISTEATGKYLITHNIDSPNISFSTQYCWGGTGSTYSRTPMIQHVSTTQCRLYLNIGNSLYNPQNNRDYVMLYCYKFT